MITNEPYLLVLALSADIAIVEAVLKPLLIQIVPFHRHIKHPLFINRQSMPSTFDLAGQRHIVKFILAVPGRC